jgi:Aldo/keto reductase family
MKHIALGGLDVSRIGLGTMATSGYYLDPHSSDAESVRTIRRALDLGVTHIDTAEIYGPYANEELVGLAINGRRGEVVLATRIPSESSGVRSRYTTTSAIEPTTTAAQTANRPEPPCPSWRVSRRSTLVGRARFRGSTRRSPREPDEIPDGDPHGARSVHGARGDQATAVAAQPDLLRGDLGAPPSQELRELLGTVHVVKARRAETDPGCPSSTPLTGPLQLW